MRRSAVALAAMFTAAAAGAAAQPAAGEYARDAITVATPGREDRNLPTAACVVWENAEGLGVGPAQLRGFHGLSMTINVKPLSGDTAPTESFADGLKSLKAMTTGAPAWMFAALEKSRSAIERACAEDRRAPFLIRKLSATDKAG